MKNPCGQSAPFCLPARCPGLTEPFCSVAVTNHALGPFPFPFLSVCCSPSLVGVPGAAQSPPRAGFAPFPPHTGRGAAGGAVGVTCPRDCAWGPCSSSSLRGRAGSAVPPDGAWDPSLPATPLPGVPGLVPALPGPSHPSGSVTRLSGDSRALLLPGDVTNTPLAGQALPNGRACSGGGPRQSLGQGWPRDRQTRNHRQSLLFLQRAPGAGGWARCHSPELPALCQSRTRGGSRGSGRDQV